MEKQQKKEKSLDNNLLTTRLIIKNIPKYYTESKLIDLIQSQHNIRVTDAKIPQTSSGVSRQIAFIGVHDTSSASQLIKCLDKTFLDTSKVYVNYAYPPGAKQLPRPWSRHTPGSTAYKKQVEKKSEQRIRKIQAINEKANRNETSQHDEKLHNQNDNDDIITRNEFLSIENKRKGHLTWSDANPVVNDITPAAKRRKKTTRNVERTIVSLTPVKPNSAGISNVRKHIQFCDDDDDDDDKQSEHDGNDDDGEPLSSTTQGSSSSISDTEKDTTDALSWLRHKSEQQASKEVIDPNNSTDLKSDTSEQEFIQDLENKASSESINNENFLTSSNNTTIEDDDDDDLMSVVADTGRLLILNLPYDTTENDLRSFLVQRFGEISDIHICKDQGQIKSLGRAFVTFAFPEHAVRAVSELNMTIFQGRILRIKGALPPKPRTNQSEKIMGKNKKSTSSFKRLHEERLKKEAENVQTWNLLYISANTALDATAEALGVEKKSLLGLDEESTLDNHTLADSMAARVALGETYIIKETKKWLKEQGLNMSCFERQGTTLLSSHEVDKRASVPRSDDAFIIKHLPTSVTETDIHLCFSKQGPLVRCTLSPSKTVAIVQYMHASDARRAFRRLAYSRFKDSIPLFLEWAPNDIYVTAKPTSILSVLGKSSISHSLQDDTATSASLNDTTEILMNAVKEAEELEQQPSHTSLFVKNLNFSTIEASLEEKFKSIDGFIGAKIMRKQQKILSKNEFDENVHQTISKSMGYGFLEFKSSQGAYEALKRFQSIVIDGHALELKISERSPGMSTSKSTAPTDSPLLDISKITNKLAVRNLSFQATKKDLKQLFGAFGNLVGVRIPKKIDGTSRGYGFVEFLSRTEALAALEALQHTHLYGRRLVLEPAEQVDSSATVEELREHQDQKVMNQNKVTESRKRKIKDLLDSSTTSDKKFVDQIIR